MLRFLTTLLLAFVLAASAGAHGRAQVFVTGAPVTTTSATAVDVTGLAMPVLAGIDVWFRCKLPVTSSLLTSRVLFSITGPASTAVRWANESSSVLVSTRLYEIATALATLSPIGDTPTTITFTTLEGILRPSAAGTYQVRFASETAGQTSTVEIGAWCEYSLERHFP
jgi:hypothetical protein